MIDLSAMGTRLRQRRERHGWTLRELADLSGVSASAICHFEIGKHSLVAERIAAVAVSLGTTTDWILLGK